MLYIIGCNNFGDKYLVGNIFGVVDENKLRYDDLVQHSS